VRGERLADVAPALGVGPTLIGRIERGERAFTLCMRTRFAAYYRTPPDHLQREMDRWRTANGFDDPTSAAPRPGGVGGMTLAAWSTPRMRMLPEE
jgi:hypothetical protein